MWSQRKKIRRNRCQRRDAYLRMAEANNQMDNSLIITDVFLKLNYITRVFQVNWTKVKYSVVLFGIFFFSCILNDNSESTFNFQI